MAETKTIEIRVGRKTFEAEIGPFSTLAKMVENGEVPAVVREKKYHLLYKWTSKGWVFQKIVSEIPETGEDERIITCDDPREYPHNLGERSEEEILQEWKSIDGVGKATAKRAYEEFGEVTDADLDELKNLKGFGEKNVSNVKDHISNLET